MVRATISHCDQPVDCVYEEADVSSGDDEPSNNQHNSAVARKFRMRTSVKELRGRPKSGRIWKLTHKNRSSVVKKVAAWNTPWEKKELSRTLTAAVKSHQADLIQQRRQQRQSAKEAKVIRDQRTKANALKAEIVQVVKNSNKIKRMKKKQLRKIETRDTTVVQPVDKK